MITSNNSAVASANEQHSQEQLQQQEQRCHRFIHVKPKDMESKRKILKLLSRSQIEKIILSVKYTTP